MHIKKWHILVTSKFLFINFLFFKNNEINLPKFKDYKKQLEKYKEGLYIVHSNQCPWVARSIDEFSQIAKKNKLKLNIIELKNSTKYFI